jgi:hypothetical protein
MSVRPIPLIQLSSARASATRADALGFGVLVEQASQGFERGPGGCLAGLMGQFVIRGWLRYLGRIATVAMIFCVAAMVAFWMA